MNVVASAVISRGESLTCVVAFPLTRFSRASSSAGDRDGVPLDDGERQLVRRRDADAGHAPADAGAAAGHGSARRRPLVHEVGRIGLLILNDRADLDLRTGFGAAARGDGLDDRRGHWPANSVRNLNVPDQGPDVPPSTARERQ